MPEPARETGKYVRSLEQALVRLALEQHGVFGLDQLRALGMTEDAARKRCATGRFHRIHRGVYSLVP